MSRSLSNRLGVLAKRFAEPDFYKDQIKYRMFRQSWNVGVTVYPVHIVAGLEGMQKQNEALHEVMWMEEETSHFKADPFIVKSNKASDEYILYYENFSWSKSIGKIDRVIYNGKGFSRPVLSLDSTFHLSYPFAIDHLGIKGYVPEHSKSGDVSLYLTDGAGEIVEKRSLMKRLPLIDCTFFEHDGLLWLFATKPGAAENSDLFVFYAEGLDKPWREHELNPVKSDASNARPAGKPFTFHNQLFRPAQNCTSHYGQNIVVNQITKLTTSEFEEKPVSEIRPLEGGRYSYGLHTISHCDQYSVIDGARLTGKIHPLLDGIVKFIV